MTLPITVVIPSIPPRTFLLERAKSSIRYQTQKPEKVIVQIDTDRNGAARTRQNGLELVHSEWVAFLDDDDEFLPQHLEALYDTVMTTGADYVYSWYHVIGGPDPLPHFGKVFNHCDPTQTTVTTLVRTELAQAAGFVHPSSTPTPDGNTSGEDWLFTLKCIELGGYIVHRPERTWNWYHWGGNTSGRPIW